MACVLVVKSLSLATVVGCRRVVVSYSCRLWIRCCWLTLSLSLAVVEDVTSLSLATVVIVKQWSLATVVGCRIVVIS